MGKEKILEIGAEGGSLSFYRSGSRTNSKYSSRMNEESFASFEKLLKDYSSNHDPILWYYPVEIHPDFRSKLIPLLLEEYRSHPKDHFMNLYSWEEKLDIGFNEFTEDGVQVFEITPVEKTKTYSYNHFGDERVLESVTTDYSNQPKYKQILIGIGTVEGDTFIIRSLESDILGVFPLMRYEVKLNNDT